MGLRLLSSAETFKPTDEFWLGTPTKTGTGSPVQKGFRQIVVFILIVVADSPRRPHIVQVDWKTLTDALTSLVSAPLIAVIPTKK